MKSIFSALFILLFSTLLYAAPNPQTAIATFAGGCFWCTQADFDKVPGVVETIVGYTGGHVKDPTYQQVSHGETGHYESVQIIYNPNKVSYQQLLSVFWHNIDPTDAKGQFCDIGSSYRAAIFYNNNEQKKLAIGSKQQLIKSGRFRQMVTEILPAKPFYLAEEYHQKYYQKNPVKYKYYRYTCGRDQRLKQLWGTKNN